MGIDTAIQKLDSKTVLPLVSIIAILIMLSYALDAYLSYLSIKKIKHELKEYEK